MEKFTATLVLVTQHLTNINALHSEDEQWVLTGMTPKTGLETTALHALINGNQDNSIRLLDGEWRFVGQS